MNTGKIRLLEDSVVARIAAAESISGPASVVKELLENAIDAGATRVDVSVTRAGKDVILVSDNGDGMSSSDLVLCTKRHATSKIRTVEDLNETLSLGFRGEALASIAAVSDLSISSGHQGMGNEISFPSSNVKPAPFIQGTRIRVENLFREVPARLNFLRSDRAEMMAIMQVIKNAALFRPEIHFTMRSDGDVVLYMRAGDMNVRLTEVTHKHFVENALPMGSVDGDLRLNGWLTNQARGSTVDQFIFVNGRHIKSSEIVAVIRDAYGDLLPASKHPEFVLFISLLPSMVDVNAHPSKAEIRFRRPEEVYNMIREEVRRALEPKRMPKIQPLPTSQKDDKADLQETQRQRIKLGDWDLIKTEDGVCAVNRYDVMSRILSSSESVDCLPVSVGSWNTSFSNEARKLGVFVRPRTGGYDLVSVPDIEADPVLLASMLSATPQSKIRDTILRWALDGLHHIPYEDLDDVDLKVIKVDAFDQFMRKM